MGLGGASDFRITLAQPVSDITLHFNELDANLLSFTSGGSSVAFTLSNNMKVVFLCRSGW